MFLVPALTYFLISGRLGQWNKDIRICQWSYFLRCALPVILPLLALAGINRELLLWITAGIMAISYTCADFLVGKGGYDDDGMRQVIALTCKGHKTLYADPSGSAYCRYLGIKVK